MQCMCVPDVKLQEAICHLSTTLLYHGIDDAHTDDSLQSLHESLKVSKTLCLQHASGQELWACHQNRTYLGEQDQQALTGLCQGIKVLRMSMS